MAKLVETVPIQALEAQVADNLGADRFERSDERQGYRNVYRTRILYTRVGPVTLQVLQTWDESFSTDIFRCYQRSEQSFIFVIMPVKVRPAVAAAAKRIFQAPDVSETTRRMKE